MENATTKCKTFTITPAALFMICGALFVTTVVTARPSAIATQPDGGITSQASQTSTNTDASRTKGKRDLALYEQTATINELDKLPGTARAAAMAKVRDFLWQRWQAKRRARAAYTSTILQGYAPGTTQFFVEADEQGRWRITLEVQGSDTPQHFYFVELIPTEDGGSTTLHLKLNADDNSGMML